MNCTECVKRSNCEYGRCINRPFECICYSGYSGIVCDIPVCKLGCNKTGVSNSLFVINLGFAITLTILSMSDDFLH